MLQVLGKSVKPIPVMILGVLMARKRYPLAKYLFVLMIVIGVAMFMYKPKRGGSALDADHVFGWGEALLVSQCLADVNFGTRCTHHSLANYCRLCFQIVTFFTGHIKYLNE